MLKKIVCLGVLLVMAFSLAACGGRSFQSQIDELIITVNQQADKITNLENEKELQASEIMDLKNENGILTNKIAGLEKDLQNNIVENNVIREKIEESWWDGKVEVSVVFPRIVEQGKPFKIKVTTTNISGYDIEYVTGT